MTGYEMMILFVETCPALGGAQKSLLELCAALRGQNVEARVAVPPGTLSDALNAAKIPIHFLPPPKGPRILQLLRAARALRRILAQTQPSILHANNIPAGLVCAFQNFIPHPSSFILPQYVLHVRDLRFNFPLLRFAARRALAVAAISQSVFGRLSSLGIKPVLIPNGIDLSPYAPAPRPPIPRVGMVAQWARWKRHDLFLRMAPLLREHIPGVQCVLLPGEGGSDAKWETSMRALAQQNGVEILPFTRDMPRFYAGLSALVHPAADEPFGRVLYEALASGVPVVARRGPSTRHLPPPCALVDSDEPRAFAGAAATLLNSNPASWQAACLATAARYGVSTTAAKCREIYGG